ncbi:alpha/beta fold hydrolase [Roseicitreum antarcticum]|uniref:Pimeloyl-ACP methyl ester carboxylesterase n=1 Tax=Roseicitreum antarcticum TaxID=564137 RepID=A0A1H3ASU4_9RHOB|nr:alpha/beta hydrolase [Roseicitreum antarcticum]SDX32746.1 Pimeloyl-ACP methyl ester carboxylesterase [Roseicitreum antarcticum]
MGDAVVLIPGLQADRASWTHQIAHLAGDRSVIVPDGYHDLPSIAAMAGHVLDQCPGAFHLVGWSMGGYIALEVMEAAADRVQSLTLIATSARPETDGSRLRREERLQKAAKIGLRADHGETMTACVHDPITLSPDVFAAMADASVALGLDALTAQQSAIIARRDMRPLLPGLACPTLIVTGECDPVIDTAFSVEMHKLVPGARLVALAKCGHCPPLEHPDRINKLLDSWFLEQDRHAVSLRAGTMGGPNRPALADE